MGDGLDWTPYDGIEVPGAGARTCSRAAIAWSTDGRLTGDEHRGAYLPVARVLETA